MYSYYCILLVLCITSYSLSASSTLDGTCVNPTTLSFIENSLTNISDQLKGSSCSSDGATSQGLTSLLQLALVKELAKDYKDKSCDREERNLLKRINASIANKIEFLQSQVSSLSSGVMKLSRLLSERVNMTLDDEEVLYSPLLSSCDAILSELPNSPSGYYNLIDLNGNTHRVYCHMETLCNQGGGWRRIASLNMADPNEKCPTQFRTYSQDGVRACGRPARGGGCVGITFPSKDIQYTQVCGKVIGYQVGTTDGPDKYKNIYSPYIDGISLTYGNPRKHIWTLISSSFSGSRSNCPCGTTGARSAPSFVGPDYYCESSYEGSTFPALHFQNFSDPLWDGKGCGSSETNCCQRTLIPWFYRSFAYSTTEYIEMRICCNEGTENEDVPVGEYEIYVK